MPSMNPTSVGKRMPGQARAAAVLATLALVGCEGRVTMDLGTNVPADPTIAQVLVDLDGVELQGGGGESLRFDAPVQVDLVELGGGNLFRLFTDEDISDGHYTGVRLLFSSDDEDRNDDIVVLTDNEEFPLTVVEGDAAAVDFTVDKNKSSRDDIVLTLDLRQSLSYRRDRRDYTLTPLVRAARVENTGQISGTVTTGCPAGSSIVEGGAVYLFNEGVTPDDRGSAGAAPYLTTAITTFATGVPSYTLSYIPAGTYTIAMTCDGNRDDPATDDDIRFQEITNVRVRAEETVTHNFD